LQDVQWQECRQIFSCARIEVPLDYSRPRGKAIKLAVIKRPAEDTEQRIGSLLVNPGGPGGSGVRYVENAKSVLGQPLLDHFDIVGFDPRGVGESTPIDCLPDDQLDTLIAADPDPDTAAEIQASVDLLRQFTAGCERRSGDVLAHVSTVEAARDIDILRVLVGEEKVDYLGASYGTYLGATYAELFPQRVGRMVLDGAVDPSLPPAKMTLVQAAGFQTALRAYVADCVEKTSCPLGTDVDAGLARISAFFDELDAQPIPGDGERQLTEAYAVIGVWLPLYVKSYWPILTDALNAAFDGDGAQLLQLADYYTSRGAEGFTDNSNEVIYAVSCLDHPDQASISTVERSVPRLERASPVFGRVFAWGALACSMWPVQATEPAPKIDAAGADPMLVIGTTRDPATPYRWAVALADQLESGVLLSRDGDGHTAYQMGNGCIDETVESYLIDGTVPPDGKEC
jgi:pimeloyl-ACP methyl ester carboxylesterase